MSDHFQADETFSTEGPQCPHCGRQYTADEGYYYQTDYTEEECDECGNKFRIEVSHTTSWTCEPIPAAVSSPSHPGDQK